VQVRTEQDVAAMEEQRRRARAMQFQHAERRAHGGSPPKRPPPRRPTAASPRVLPQCGSAVRARDRKVGATIPALRSGLKYKRATGA